MECFISINSKNKAKRDIDRLMLGLGYKDLAIKGVGKRHVETFIRKSLSMLSLLTRLHKGDTLVIQYPFKKFYSLQCRIAHLRGARVITLIHDLGSFRRKKLSIEQEMHRLSHTDYIIAHNREMKLWIEKQAAVFLPQLGGRNYFEGRIGCLEIFDYLSDVAPHRHQSAGGHSSIVYAGGLGERKNAFLYQAGQAVAPLSIDVYGDGNLDTTRFAPNLHYHGRIASDEFIRTAPGDWGLVWDGDSVDACSGVWGEYLRYNNPHKASFYLRAGLPVIVWRKAAMASFIDKEGVGIAVENLQELPRRIAAISAEGYSRMCEKAYGMSQRLQQGYYFHQAISEALRE